MSEDEEERKDDEHEEEEERKKILINLLHCKNMQVTIEPIRFPAQKKCFVIGGLTNILH